MTKTLLGTGVLTWNRSERASDRYGTVALIADGENSQTRGGSYLLLERVCGRGRLFVVVLEERTSTHIGDLVRGIFPKPTRAGSKILLNKKAGTVFLEKNVQAGISIGIRPDDPTQTSDWLDPRQLYRVHEHLVELWYEYETPRRAPSARRRKAAASR